MKLAFFTFILLLSSISSKSAFYEGIGVAERLAFRASRVATRGISTRISPNHTEWWGTISRFKDVKEITKMVTSGTHPFFDPYEVKDRGYHLFLPNNFGIWYRGVNNRKFKLTPGVQRLVDPNLSTDEQIRFLEETGMFTEYRLKTPNAHYDFKNPDLHRSIDNIMSWLTFMQHYGLPTRLLDWTSSPEVALFFAANNAINGTKGRLHVLNAVRLNNYVLGEKGFGVCPQDDISVSLRAELSLARNAEDLLNRKTIFEHETYITHIHKGWDPTDFLKNLGNPLAVEARRYNPRIVSQEGYFTIHGGKIFPKSMETTLPRPITLEELNYEAVNKGYPPFLIAFDVENQEEILRDLVLYGINENSLLGGDGDPLTKEMEELAKNLKERWTLQRIF